MIIHTFCFRWKPGTTEAQKERAYDEINELHSQIPGILETNIGANFSPRSQGYEFGGVMKFEDRESLDAYTSHPIHLQLLSWLVPLVEALEVDFEV
jgi:antibiotic biosynthesis monooxygenase (ABM) superfamily enzyme